MDPLLALELLAGVLDRRGLAVDYLPRDILPFIVIEPGDLGHGPLGEVATERLLPEARDHLARLDDGPGELGVAMERLPVHAVLVCQLLQPRGMWSPPTRAPTPKDDPLSPSSSRIRTPNSVACPAIMPI